MWAGADIFNPQTQQTAPALPIILCGLLAGFFSVSQFPQILFWSHSLWSRRADPDSPTPKNDMIEEVTIKKRKEVKKMHGNPLVGEILSQPMIAEAV